MTVTSPQERTRAGARASTRGRLRVAHFPGGYTEDPSAYIGLLCRALERQGVVVTSGVELGSLRGARQPPVDVVHLHWLEYIAPSDSAGVVGMLRTLFRHVRLVATLASLRRRGIRIVWTVHNLRPHEPRWPRLESLLARSVMRICDAAIVHSSYARELVGKHYGHVEKATVIPIGHFIDVFPADGRTRGEIRRAWSLPEDSFVFLAFGQVRPYKRLVELVRAFRCVEGGDLRLIIAGAPTIASEADRLREAARGDSRVILDLRRIPDDEVHGLHRAADACVVAYRDVFSSAALLLAISNGVPVVAPVTGAASELLAAPAIEGFAPGDLPAALDRMRRGDRETRSRAALETAMRFSWADAASATEALYRRATARTNPHADGSPRLKVGLLLPGKAEGGIHRYSRMIGAELQRLPGVSVQHEEAELSSGGVTGLRRAIGAVVALRRADVVIVPYGRNRLWAAGRSRLLQLLIVHLGLRRRTVSDFHDVYDRGDWRTSEWWAVTINTLLARAVITHAGHERSRLRRIPRADCAHVIPLFVERRVTHAREAARATLSVDAGSRVLGMVGWLHPRKNCELALRAVSLLPDDVQLWLIGGGAGGDTSYVERLQALAADLGIEDRMLVTGYLSESEFDLRLAALDVGLSPYLNIAASSSISTLLGARLPVVATDLPATRELRRIAPGAVTLCPDTTPRCFAAAISAVLDDPPGPEAFTTILENRSPETTAHRYLEPLRSARRRSSA